MTDCPRCGGPTGEHDCKPDVMWTDFVKMFHANWSCWDGNEYAPCWIPKAVAKAMADAVSTRMRRLLAESPVVTRAREAVNELDAIIVAPFSSLKVGGKDGKDNSINIGRLIDIRNALRDALPEKTDAE